jgi:hypothetical protein
VSIPTLKIYGRERRGSDGHCNRYPYVAAEVLCSEIWSIVETCVSRADELLGPFWETVLDIPPEEMKTQMVMAAHFTKINTIFLSKKPAEASHLPIAISFVVTCLPDASLHSVTTKRH